MKIVLINQEHAAFGGPGGAERSVQSIADYMAAAGHQVTFISMARASYTRDMTESGIHSVRDINGVKTILVAKKSQIPTHADLLVPIILREQPDIVHTNVFHRAPQLWQALAPLGIPVLHTLREYKLMCSRNMFDGVRDCGAQCEACHISSRYAVEMSRYVDGVVGISKFTLERHLNRGFFPEATLKRVIPNSYKRRGSAPPTIASRGKVPRVGFLGRMHASKGINLVIDAFERLTPGTASLLMAGDLQDEQISARVQKLGETHQARYIGFVDPVDFFAEIDVLLAPSIWHEPFGRITIEAFAHGVPVIATTRGGLPDIVEEEKTGWLFDPDRSDDLVAILKKLAAIRPERMDELRANALDAAKRYLPSIVGGLYLEAYKEVILAKQAKTSVQARKLLDFYTDDARRQNVVERMRSRRSHRESRPIRVLVVAGEFPKLSETFVLNHVTGLLDLGADVRVLYTRRGPADQMPIDYLKYELDRRTISIVPTGRDNSPLQALGSETRAVGVRLGAALTNAAQTDAKAAATYEHAKETLESMHRRLLDLYAAQTISEQIDDVDVIHCHFGHRPKMIYKYLDMIGAKVPVVCSFHGIDMSAHIQTMGPGLYDDIKNRLHKALPISDYFRRRLIGLGFDAKDVQVHRVGVDCSKFTFADRGRSDDEPLRLVSVGRCVPKKGFDFSIRGVAAALARRPDMRLVYTIIGDGTDMPKLKTLVNELGVADRIKLVGSRPHTEVTQTLSASHAMLATSVTGDDGDMEGIPTVTMEAMASGLPVVSTFHSGIPEAVVHGYTGLLVKEHDVEGLAEAIIALYENPGIASKFGRQGRAHVLNEFNIARQNMKVLDLYESIAIGSPN